MRKHASVVKVGVLFFLAVILTVRAPGVVAAAQTVSNAYFSSGQAVIDPQNQAKSQQQAIKNFMTQGLIEAMASFLGPDQMGAQFDKLEKSVLAGPEKYINTYQIYSEKQVGGEFQVIGKITVSMDLLKGDLAKLGVLGAKNTPAATAASSQPASAAVGPATPAVSPQPASAAAGPATPAVSSPPTSAAAAPATPSASAHPGAPQAAPAPVGAKGQASQPQEAQAPASAPAAATPAGTGKKGAGAVARGIRPTKKEVLWAVVEKWDEKYVLPTDSGDVRCFFARSIANEMDGFGFSILLPRPGSIEMDNDGNIPPYQAVSLAGNLGVKEVVVGKVSYLVDRQNQQVSLNADLRVIKLGKDQAGVRIQKTLSMEDLSNQSGAFELARRIAPQLSSLLGGPKTIVGNTGPGTAEFPAHLGKLVIHLSSLQYAHWTELENILRRQFPTTMRVDDLQIGPAETSVNLDGIDSGYLLKMNGTMLPSGVQVRIDSYSIQAGAMKISFVPPKKVQAEPK